MDEFTKETGIKARYDTFDPTTRWRPSCWPASPATTWWCRRLISSSARSRPAFSEAGQGEAAEPRQHVARRLRSALASYDPGNAYAVNYMWGTTGIGYNVKKAREALGGDGRIDNWDIIFARRTSPSSRTAACICSIPSDDILSAALHYLGLDPNTTKETDLQKAADLVARSGPPCASFTLPNMSISLASGEICLVVGFSGDIKQAQKRAAEAKNGVDIAYAIPKEGAQLSVRQSRHTARRQERG